MKEKWTQDIQNRLKDFPKKAPEGLLDDIKSEMLRRGLSTAPAASKRPATIFRIAAVAAAMALLFGIGHLFHWQATSVLPEGQETMVFPTVAERFSTATEEEKEIASNIPTPLVTSRLSAQTNRAHVVQPDTINTNEEAPSEKATEEKEKTNTEEKAESPNRQTSQPKVQTDEAIQSSKWAYTPSRKKNAHVDISIYYAGVLSLATSPNQVYRVESSPPPSNSPIDPGGSNDGTDSTAVSSRATSRSFSRKKSLEEAKHHIPVKLGISLRYYLNERWHIQSGLTYSYLASDLFYKGTSPYETEQKLHYLGVPLQIGVRIWQSERFKGYISAGGQIERLVSGKATTHYTAENQQPGTLIENISDKKLLFSALASIGAEYMIGKDLSLYAEPGIHCYFDNGSELNTYYNEQPLNFNITVGFRFHWKK